MTEVTDTTNVTPVSGGQVSPAPVSRNSKVFGVVIAAVFALGAAWMLFTGYTRYAASLHHVVTTTTYSDVTPGIRTFLVPYGLIAAFGIICAILNLGFFRGIGVQALLLTVIMGIMISFVAGVLLTAVAQDNTAGPKKTASLSAWLKTEYDVDNYPDVLDGKGTFYELDASGVKQTFAYQATATTLNVQHVSAAE